MQKQEVASVCLAIKDYHMLSAKTTDATATVLDFVD